MEDSSNGEFLIIQNWNNWCIHPENTTELTWTKSVGSKKSTSSQGSSIKDQNFWFKSYPCQTFWWDFEFQSLDSKRERTVDFEILILNSQILLLSLCQQMFHNLLKFCDSFLRPWIGSILLVYKRLCINFYRLRIQKRLSEDLHWKTIKKTLSRRRTSLIIQSSVFQRSIPTFSSVWTSKLEDFLKKFAETWILKGFLNQEHRFN